MAYQTGPIGPSSFTVRPLDKGAMSDINAQLVPPGAFTCAREYIIKENGPERRGGLELYKRVGGVSVSVPLVWDALTQETARDMTVYFSGTGVKKILVFGSKLLYAENVTSDVYSPVPWITSANNVVAAGTSTRAPSGSGVGYVYTVTRTSTPTWVADGAVLAEDFVWITKQDATDVSDSNIIARIATVADGTLTFYTEEDLGETPTLEFWFCRQFRFPPELFPEYTMVPRPDTGESYLYIVDGSLENGVMRYNGSVLEKVVVSDSAVPANITVTSARTIRWFADRLWFGYTTETVGGGTEIGRQRIRWSTALNEIDVRTSSVLDLAGISGSIMSFDTCEQLITVFAEDGVFFGRPTQVPNLPFLFTKVNTIDISILGQRAHCPFLNSVVFASRNDLYLIDVNGQCAPMNIPIKKDTLRAIGSKPYISRLSYYMRDNILLLSISTSGESLTTIGVMYLPTKAWSTWKINHACLAVAGAAGKTGYDDITDAFDDVPESYDSFAGDPTTRNLIFCSIDGHLHRLSTRSSDELTDGSDLPIESCLITGDLDLDIPYALKTFLRLSIKEAGQVLAPHNFTIRGSTDKGITWNPLGTITIPVNGVEEEVHFRMTGDIARFSIFNNEDIPSFTVEELDFKVRPRGKEEHRVSV